MGVVYDFSVVGLPTASISAMRLAAMFFSDTTSRTLAGPSFGVGAGGSWLSEPDFGGALLHGGQ